MTIASLTTVATSAPAPKGAASPVPTAAVAPDSQAAAIATETRTVSSLELAVAAARQSAAARQDGLSVLMANLLRATSMGILPMPVQQAVDALLALHLPTDVAPDATTVKTALLTSGLFTEANLASGTAAIPRDVKTALLQLNGAAETWLARATPTSDTPASPQSATALPAAARPEQAVPLAAPLAREPLRRPRANGAESKPAPPSVSVPQRSPAGNNPLPLEAGLQTDAAPDAETARSALNLLSQITQLTKSAPALPQAVSAALALVSKALASTIPVPEARVSTAVPAPTTAMQAAQSPAVGPAEQPTAPPLAKPDLPITKTSSQSPAPLQQSPSSGLSPRGSSPVEQLLALQLTPAPTRTFSPAPVVEVSPDALPPPLAEADANQVASPLALRQPNTMPASADVVPAPSSTVNSARERIPLLQPYDGKPLLPAFAQGPEAALPPAPNAAPIQEQLNTAPQPPLQQAPLQQPSSQQPPPQQLLQEPSPQAPLPPQPSPEPPAQSSLQQPSLPRPEGPSELLDLSRQQSLAQQPVPADLAAAISVLSNAGLLPAATTSGGVPNDLKTLLALFNLAPESGPPRASPNAISAPTGTPNVPPPVRGVPSKAQPASLATLPNTADPITTAKQLLSGSDAALARQTLLQISSLPDATPQSRPTDARWVFDLPLMTPQGAAVAQMIIERDSSGTGAEKPTPVWRVQFAIDIEPLGPVRANLALSGTRTWVTITADRPESLDKLRSGVSWLADALQATELQADIAFQSGGALPQRDAASRFMDHAS